MSRLRHRRKFIPLLMGENSLVPDGDGDADGAASVGGGSGIPSDSLILVLESTDFDAQADLTAVTAWNDKSPNGNNFAPTSAIYNPWVDQVNTLNGHATVRFLNSGFIRHLQLKGLNPSSWSGVVNFTAAEEVVIYKKDNDPSGAQDQGSPFFPGPTTTLEDAWNFVDGNLYINFADSTRPFIGNAIQDLRNWHAVNIRDTKNGAAVDRVLYVGSELMVNSIGTGTWRDFNSAAGAHLVGASVKSVSTFGNSMTGNVAAVYFWSKVLSTAERTQLAEYILNLWGITIPTS